MANFFRGFGGTSNQTFQAQSSDGLGDSTVSGPVAAMLGLNIGDPIDDLPKNAADRLRGLREESEELSVLARSNFSDMQELQMKSVKLKAASGPCNKRGGMAGSICLTTISGSAPSKQSWIKYSQS